MGFLKSLFGLETPEVEPLPPAPINPDPLGASTLLRRKSLNTGRLAFTSPLGETAKPVRKTLLSE